MTVPKNRQRISGRVLQQSIVKEARARGWRCAHFMAVQTKHRGWTVPVAADGKGFPDLVLVRDRVIYAEVKGDGDSIRPEQREWLDALRLAGQECYVWGPREWVDESIIETLDQRESRNTRLARQEALDELAWRRERSG